ncbi:MAG: DHH family phosphoesterase, partial [Lachnospiraceae bacterium]|nr:DHH family phosphoesterase [Lachnospiraceae bacterium]
MRDRVRLKGRLKNYLTFEIYLGILLILVNVGMIFVDRMAAALLAVFTVVYWVVSLSFYIHSRGIYIGELVSFATQYGQIQKELLRDLNLPYTLLDASGHIVWMNTAFEKASRKQKGYEKSIQTIFPELTREKLPSPKDMEDREVEVSFEDNYYRAKLQAVALSEMVEGSEIFSQAGDVIYLVALYLYDETALQIALKELDSQSLAVGLVYQDNYEEAMEGVEDVRRSLLAALVDREISQYVAARDGLCKKLEKDKFLVILRKEAVESMREEKFDILDKVKTVNIGNEMAVTISIGIGLGGLTYAQNYEFARSAIELGLGRGGDQAVVKTSDSTVFYGGKTKQVEKNTRVKARVKAHALEEIINGRDQVFIMGHKRGDVDSFGSSVGVWRIAKSLDREAHIVLNENTTSVGQLVNLFKDNSNYEEDMILTNQEAIDLVGPNAALVVVDVNKPSITECPELLHRAKSIVVIDHHRQGTETIENATLSYIEPYASSACEMVAEILQYITGSVRMRTEEADTMFSGIMIDTNNFVTKAGVRTFEAAAFLRRMGADVARVRKLFREDAAAYKARADAVGQAEIYQGAYAISACQPVDVPNPTVVGAQAANELLNIRGIKASFVLTDYQNIIYISARSIDEVNVQVIMERLGGGGHLNIAATQLSETTLVEAIHSLKGVIDT